MVARDYDGEIPENYFVVRSLYSDYLYFLSRTFPTSEGSVEAAAKHAENFRIYPLSHADNPPTQDFVLLGDRRFSQDWPRDIEAFEWLGQHFSKDRAPAEARAHLGNMRKLGLTPGVSFEPDERANRILSRAAASAARMIKLSMIVGEVISTISSATLAPRISLLP